MSNFTVISDDEAVELRKLREFYKNVVSLTANHDVVETDSFGHGVAVVYPNKLGLALEKVNPKWYESDQVS